MNENPSDACELAFSASVGSDGGVPVVEVRGEIDLATVPKLLEAIGIAGSRLDGRPLIFVDLGQVRFIDVYGTRTLVQESQAMHELGGELRLVIPRGGPVARVFELLGVERMVGLHHEVTVPGVSGE